MAIPDPMNVVHDFVDALCAGDLDALTALLADDFVGHVTTADGGVRDANRDEYVASIKGMDVPTANLKVAVPNMVEVERGKVLIMVTVEAERAGRSLHNFSGQLATVVDGHLTELWMVDALPAEGDEFWSA